MLLISAATGWNYKLSLSDVDIMPFPAILQCTVVVTLLLPLLCHVRMLQSNGGGGIITAAKELLAEAAGAARSADASTRRTSQ